MVKPKKWWRSFCESLRRILGISLGFHHHHHAGPRIVFGWGFMTRRRRIATTAAVVAGGAAVAAAAACKCVSHLSLCRLRPFTLLSPASPTDGGGPSWCPTSPCPAYCPQSGCGYPHSCFRPGTHACACVCVVTTKGLVQSVCVLKHALCWVFKM